MSTDLNNLSEFIYRWPNHRVCSIHPTDHGEIKLQKTLNDSKSSDSCSCPLANENVGSRHAPTHRPGNRRQITRRKRTRTTN